MPTPWQRHGAERGGLHDLDYLWRVAGIGGRSLLGLGLAARRRLYGCNLLVSDIPGPREPMHLTIYDCTNGFALCMRMQDPVGISREATGGRSTGNPNEFTLLDLTPLVPYVGGYSHPVQGTSDFGPYPSDKTKRDAFRGPGYWNVDTTLSKRIRFGERYAVQFRFEAYNLFNHPNMYVDSGSADISSFDAIHGYKGSRGTPDQRRLQFGCALPDAAIQAPVSIDLRRL